MIRASNKGAMANDSNSAQRNILSSGITVEFPEIRAIGLTPPGHQPGALPASYIIGPVTWIYWPISRIKRVGRVPSLNATTFPQATRKNRRFESFRIWSTPANH